MDSLAGKTGIAIHPGVNLEAGRTVGKVLHAMHLDKLLARWGASLVKDRDTSLFALAIYLDGVERRDPLYETHFLECGPGDHEVAVHPWNWSATGSQWNWWSDKKIKVTVPPGEVVHLVYTIGGPGQTTLEIRRGDALT